MNNDRTTNRTLSFERTLHTLGLVNSPECDRCKQESEMASHVLCVCEALAALRYKHLCQHFMKPGDLRGYLP